jgi:hypothetical protein
LQKQTAVIFIKDASGNNRENPEQITLGPGHAGQHFWLDKRSSPARGAAGAPVHGGHCLHGTIERTA